MIPSSRFYILPSTLALILLISCCNIIEDRDICERYDSEGRATLVLDMNLCAYDFHKITLMTPSEGSNATDTFSIRKDDAIYRKDIPMGSVRYSVFASKSSFSFLSPDMDGLLDGKDSIYAYSGGLYARRGENIQTILLHKQFTTLSLKFSSSRNLPAYITIPSSSIDPMTLAPSGEEAILLFRIDDNGNAEINIPRQRKNSEIHLFLEGLEESYNIGNALDNSDKFSWESTDLDDIHIDIDQPTDRFTIKVLPWTSDDGVYITTPGLEF